MDENYNGQTEKPTFFGRLKRGYEKIEEYRESRRVKGIERDNKAVERMQASVKRVRLEAEYAQAMAKKRKFEAMNKQQSGFGSNIVFTMNNPSPQRQVVSVPVERRRKVKVVQQQYNPIGSGFKVL